MDKHAVLRRYFGYDEFRPGQETLIDSILSGRDVFGIMPTGGGKSICYQVPAMLLPGVTLVVSPLISLMRDQVMALKAAGVPAAYINSTLTGPQMQAVYRNLRAGKYKLVYIAPERLDYSGFAELAAKLRISLIAVDEAHCISQWGQDFRPSYLRIVSFIETLPIRPVVGAFTATATQLVQEDIERILLLREPVRVLTGFDRPNLCFSVLRPQQKDKELLGLLTSRRRQSGIVYCATRKKVESVCRLLQDRGYAAARYHAGLEETERTENQEDFIHDRVTVMVATNAFGMGIDKSNVSFVIHYNMPKSMEAYYQEAGRAGRDGTAADCILLYSASDVTTAKYLIQNSTENEELTPEQREQIYLQDMERLAMMVGYCKTRDCLRGYILEYFGQKHPAGCGNCGNCAADFAPTDITTQAQMILSCIKRVYDKLGYHVGTAVIARVLQGSKEKKLLQLGLQSLPTYGLLKTTGRTQIREMMLFLETEGYLLSEQNYQTIRLTQKAAQVLYQGKRVVMPLRKEQKEEAVSGVQKLSADAQELYERLRQLRAELAKEANVAAFMIFSNATLQDMAKKCPRSLSEFRRVSGVGELKAAWYGEAFTKCIRQFLEQEGEENEA